MLIKIGHKDNNLKNLFENGFNKFEDFIDLNQKDSYVACFTTNEDSIQNWMAYGRNPVNYSIEFTKKDIDNATRYCGRSNLKESVDKYCG